MEEEPDGPGQGKREYNLFICIIFYEFHCCCSKLGELSAFSGVPKCTKSVETVLSSLPSFHINLFALTNIIIFDISQLLNKQHINHKPGEDCREGLPVWHCLPSVCQPSVPDKPTSPMSSTGLSGDQGTLPNPPEPSCGILSRSWAYRWSCCSSPKRAVFCDGFFCKFNTLLLCF